MTVPEAGQFKFNWHKDIGERRGADERLHGITVFHDFEWADLFPHGRTIFRNGRDLARLVISECPEGKQPALLMTRDTHVAEGLREDEVYNLVVINIDRYLRVARRGSVAAAYLAGLSAMNVVTISGMRELTVDAATLARVMQNTLNEQAIKVWIEADPGRLVTLSRILQELNLPGESWANEEISDAFIALLRDEVWGAISRAGLEIPTLLAHQRVWEERKAICDEFEAHLSAEDWSEPLWQHFFETNTWIFGYGLSYKFLDIDENRPYVGGRGVGRRGGQEADFLMHSAAEVRFTVLVEIKRPDSSLTMNEPYRNHVYGPGIDVASGATQVQQACWRWVVEGARTDENREQLESANIYTQEPHGILVVGNTSQLSNDADRRRSFESFRRNIRTPEILTFDELLYRAQEIVRIGENAQAEGEAIEEVDEPSA